MMVNFIHKYSSKDNCLLNKQGSIKMVELVLVQRREERNRIKPIFTDKVGKCEKYF